MRRVIAFVGVVCGLGLGSAYLFSGCSSDDADFWDDDELAFEVDGFDWGDATTEVDAEGDSHWKELGVVTLEGAGGAKHEVSVDLEVIRRDGIDKSVLYVTDTATGNERTYSYEPAKSALTIGNDTGSVSIVRNPDASYTVNDQPAANGKAAVQLLKASPVYADASAWGFLMTYGICQSCISRAAHRSPVNCADHKQNIQQEAPAICDVFKDLCDCAACDKSGKASACTKCL